MKRARFNARMRETIAVVRRDKLHFREQSPQASFTPYTGMLHCLYLNHNTTFRTALRKMARESFEAWLQKQADA